MARAKKPERDVSFALRLPPKVYAQLRALADRRENSINAVLVQAAKEKLQREMESQGNRTPAPSRA